MFRLFDAEDENKFTWESIGDVIDGRKNLGEEMPVYVRRGATIPMYPEEVDCTDEMDLSKSILVKIDDAYRGFWADR